MPFESDNVKSITKNADIIVSAIGSAEIINSSFISKDATIIDVGMNINKDGNLCGDVKYNEVLDMCSSISPVPRGIGSITTSILAKKFSRAH